MAFSHDLMEKAKISARATYLKCLHDLNEMGYIRYERSYQRNTRSKVFLNFGAFNFCPHLLIFKYNNHGKNNVRANPGSDRLAFGKGLAYKKSAIGTATIPCR
jgi:hypothetical protein